MKIHRYFVLFALLVCGYLPNTNSLYAKIEKNIVIISPGYNNKNWYKKNLDSIFSQDYTNFRLIYIDDASTDGTGSLVKKYIEENGFEDKVTLILNKTNQGALCNFYNAIWSCEDSDIIVTLDADDWFPHNNVLITINDEYSKDDIWLTYGQYQRYPDRELGNCRAFPQRIISKNTFRSYPWISSHLRTFYAGLFKKIEKEDLLYDGKFFEMAWDLAFMFPMLEMSRGHFCFIPEVLYIYNRATPLNDDKISREKQLKLEKIIRGKKCYKKTDTPF